ncbi:MAG: DUF362 domain-containing protein [Chlorobi bacterium]|nr:DUF362 domain-containing protein [Chlorobiota bacterium]
MPDNVSRRSFLKKSTVLAGAAVLTPPLAANATSVTAPEPAETTAYKYPKPGRIVIVEHPDAVKGYNNVDEAVVQQMFDYGIQRFTGITSSPADALASLFPGLTKSKKIAIKPNLLNSSVPTRKELVKAVINRLVQMLGGFPASNITLFERHSFSSRGYTTSYFGHNVKMVRDSTFPDLGYYIYCGGKNRPYSKSLHDSDYLINMPVLKDHSCSTALNMTLAFKNHMGTLNPGGSLGIHCNKKATIDIMASSVMVAKQVLVIMDGLYAVYNGGPGGAPQATPKKIFISQDPVTNDYQGRKLINELRVANGRSPKAATYIEESSKPPYSLGVADPNQMDVIEVALPVELTHFSAALEGENVTLRWVTAKESNNAGFGIERSPDGETGWKEVGFVAGRGTTSNAQEYRYVDTPGDVLRSATELFYRLRQVDVDGKTEYSPVVRVIVKPEESSWQLDQNYPNPFYDMTDIPVQLNEPGLLRVEVLDVRGSRVKVLTDELKDAGTHHLTWEANGLPSGVYICRAQAHGLTREIRMIMLK